MISMSNSSLDKILIKNPILEIQQDCEASNIPPPSSSHDPEYHTTLQKHQQQEGRDNYKEKDEGDDEEEENIEKDEEEEEENTSKVEDSSTQMKAINDDGDEEEGFKTPTSLDHKIPLMKQCPPAPRKPKKIPQTKRKASSPNALRNNLQLLDHLAHDVEPTLMFPRPVIIVSDHLHQKVKKARRDKDDTP